MRILLAVFVWVFSVTTSSVAAERAPPLVLGGANTYRLGPTSATELEDPTGELDIDEVARSDTFRPLATPNYDDQRMIVLWLNFRVVNHSGAAAWLLSVSPACEAADLYVPDSTGRYYHRSFGYSVPFARHPAPVGFDEPSISLGAEALHGASLFLRLNCPRMTELSTGIRSERSGWDQFVAIDVELICSFAMLAIFVALGLAFFALTRERLFLLSIAPVLAYINLAFARSFFTRSFPYLALPPYRSLAAASLVVFFVAHWAFIRQLLQLHVTQRKLDAYFGAALVIVSVTTVISELGPRSIDTTFLLAQVAFYLTAIIGGIIALRRGNRAARFSVIGISVTAFAIIFLYVVANFDQGLFSLATSMYEWAAPIESLLFFCAVADRLRTTLLARQAALQESDAVKLQLVAAQAVHIADIERRNLAFARFVPREFLDQLARADVVDVRLGDHVERVMSILFTDIRAFTTLSETLSPDQTFAFINAYLERAGPVIRQTGGFVDKYMGDAIMALFPSGPQAAVDAALALHGEVRRFNDGRARTGSAPIAIGIGINHGRLMLGTIGESERYETTVLSDAVNVASRFEGLTKLYGVGIVAGEALVQTLPKGKYHVRPLGTLQLKGLSRAEVAYEIFDGDPSELLLHKAQTLGAFTAAVAAYRNGDFTSSRDAFADIARQNPGDHAAAFLRDRSMVLHETRLTRWDGVDRLEIK